VCHLSWIDAGRVPKLKGAFNGEVTPQPMPAENPADHFAQSTAAVTLPYQYEMNQPIVQ